MPSSLRARAEVAQSLEVVRIANSVLLRPVILLLEKVSRLPSSRRSYRNQAAAGNATLVPLLGCVVIAVVVLVPALTLLYRLTLRGTLDTEFRPIVAADPKEGE